MPDTLKINKLAIIGVGLIGGSFAMALRKAIKINHVVGCGRGKANLEKAVQLGVIDAYTHDISEAVSDADLIFVAVPLGAMKSVFQAMKATLKSDAVVTDGGSAKEEVLKSWLSVYGNEDQFVAGHPIAGTENSGVEAAFDTLYINRRVILTPTENTNRSNLMSIRKCWELCGAEVSEMSVKQHDRVLAATSHLPHVLAYGLVDTLANSECHDEIFKYAAGGFRDFSRIASSNPEMWRDICLDNSEALTGMLKEYINVLSKITGYIERKEAESIFSIFEEAKATRDEFVDGLESTEE